MASDEGTETKCAGAVLSGMVGGFGPDEERVQVLLKFFSVPQFDDAWPLLQVLHTIVVEVPWVAVGLGRPDEAEFLSRTLDSIDKAIGHVERAELLPKLEGRDYYEVCTMVGKEGVLMPAALRLRAALWVCRERWARAGAGKPTAVNTLASSLRGSVKVRELHLIEAHPLARNFSRLAEPNSLDEFIEAASVLLESERRELQGAWRHFDRELRTIEVAATAAIAPTAPAPAPKSTPAPGTTKDDEYDEDDDLETLARGIRRGLFLGGAGPRPLPGEPPEEVAASGWIGSIAASVRNPDASGMAKHRLSQAIWGSNWLLLPNHPDVLTRTEFSKVLGMLLDVVKSGQPDEDSLVGSLALLLQGVTGRSASTLRSLRLVENFDAPIGASTFEIHADASALRLPVAWKEARLGSQEGDAPGHFVPGSGQESWLEPVAPDFLLPLPPGVGAAVSKHLVRLVELTSQRVEVIESALRHSARHVSEQLGCRITAGLVRRSFAAHLFEHCRDTALTQLICADTLGQSTAPLHYYAPTRQDIADTYWTSLCPLVGDGAPLPDAFADQTRVGSGLLVREDRVRSLSTGPSKVLQGGVNRLVDAGDWAGVHATMVDHLACMLLSVCGHRPVDALFRLTIGQFDIEGPAGAALFRDKVHDGAHDPRLVAMPHLVVRQIHSYLQHLQGLVELEPKLARQVHRIFAGKEPLLFDISETGQAVPLQIESWQKRLPQEWNALPLNWGRTSLRTRLVEAGLGPELASIQLGHLEAVGYPFSGSSPTEPTAFVSVVAPHLERLAASQGWVVRRGLPNVSGIDIPLGKLRRWEPYVSEHTLSVRVHARAWRELRRALLRHYKKEAENYVLELPELLGTDIPGVFRAGKGPWSGSPLPKETAEALRDELLASSDDASMGMARARAFVRIARTVNRKLGAGAQDPGRVILLRRPLDNAFVPNLFEAVRQVRALRIHLKDLGNCAPGSWKDFPLACARVAFALCVFGFCDRPEQVMGVLAHRQEFAASAEFDNLLLVRWGSSPGQVVGLRGLAALAVAKLRKKYPKQPVPSLAEINARLKDLLPEWTKRARRRGEGDEKWEALPDLLALLCETVSMSNRFELSPACRIALGKKGCTSASLPEQVGFLDDDPAGSVPRPPLPTPTLPIEVERVGAGSGSARSQYLDLCAVIPHQERDLELPRTGQHVPAAELFSATTRARVIAEVRAMQAETASGRGLRPVVKMLASWVENMLVEGTATTSDPADNTIRTYLTRIGGGLVEALGQGALQDLGDDELADAYEQVVDYRGDERSTAASAILRFHAHCEPAFDLPDIDLSEIRARLAKEEVRSDASLLLPSERAAAFTFLAAECGTASGIRYQRQAIAAMPFYAYGGARRSEVLGTRLGDVSIDGDGANMRLRADRARRLKTRSARRTVRVFGARARTAIKASTDWMRRDGSRVAAWRRPRAFVFSPLDAPHSALERGKVADACREALAKASGRRTEKLHRLRHLVAQEQVSPIFLSAHDYSRLSHLAIEPARFDRNEGVALPRDLLARVVSLGHADPTTTIISYFHLPWLLRSRPDKRLAEIFLKRPAVAAVLGVTLEAADDVTKKSDKPKETAWFDAVRERRRKPVASATAPQPLPSRKQSWSAAGIGRLLQLVARNGSLEDALAIVGADPGHAVSIRATVLLFERRFGLRMLDEEWGEGGQGRPRRAARVMKGGLALDSMWGRFDEGSKEERSTLVALAEGIYDHMQPRDASGIRIPAGLADQIVRTLELSGAALASIERTQSGAEAMVRIRAGQVVSEDPEAPGIETSSPRPPAKSPPLELGITFKRAVGVIWLAARLQCR